MHIGILCAMQEEANEIIEILGLTKSEDPFFPVFEGEFENKEITLLVSGIGKTYAAMGTQWLITAREADQIINIGLAGALKKEFKIGEVFLANSVQQHDVYLPWEGSHLDYLKKAIPLTNSITKKIELKEARILTGDQFIDNSTKQEELKKIGDIVEMEAFAVVSTCKKFDDVPCTILKSISDNAEEEAKGDFETNVCLAMKNAAPVLKAVLQAL